MDLLGSGNTRYVRPDLGCQRCQRQGSFGVRGGRYVARVLHVHDVNERKPRFTVRRVFLPTRATESFTVIGPDLNPVELVDEYLAWLTDCERSPNTVEAYAYDLRAFWTFLSELGLSWDRVGVMELGESAAWARRPTENVVVLAEESARLSARTVNRMLSGVVGFYEFQARRGSTLAQT
jgi:hypothetical protein